MSLKKKLQDKLKAKAKKKSKSSTKLSVFASVEHLDSDSAKSRPYDSARDLDYPNSPPWIHFT